MNLLDEPDQPPPSHPGTGHKCRECAFAAPMNFYRQDYLYCKYKTSRHTKCGHPRIRAMQMACEWFVLESLVAVCEGERD